jgi:hypothetical protein
MATGWAVVGAALLSGKAGGRRAVVSGDVRHGVAAALSGLAVVVAATALVLRDPASILHLGAAPVALAALWTAGWCAAAVGVVTLASRHIAMPEQASSVGATSPLNETADRRS